MLSYSIPPEYADLQNSPSDRQKLVTSFLNVFSERVKGFTTLLKKDRISLQMFAGDALDCSQVLSNRALVVPRWDFERMVVDDADCSSEFDTIDTNNLMDHVGILNILALVGPLLKRAPTSRLLTQVIATADQQKASSILDDLMGGDSPLICALLGLSPSSMFEPFTVRNEMGESLRKLLDPSKASALSIRLSFSWRLNCHSGVKFNIDEENQQRLCRALVKLYENMLSQNDVFEMMNSPINYVYNLSSVFSTMKSMLERLVEFENHSIFASLMVSRLIFLRKLEFQKVYAAVKHEPGNISAFAPLWNLFNADPQRFLIQERV